MGSVEDDEQQPEGCDCTELCSMGPTCPGGMMAGLPDSGCWRTTTCPTRCVEGNHPGREHEQWVAEARPRLNCPVCGSGEEGCCVCEQMLRAEAAEAERDELRAEVERLRGQLDAAEARRERELAVVGYRLQTAEAKVARVEALLSAQQERHTEDGDGRCQWCDAPLDECDIVILRAALADAPAEQRAEERTPRCECIGGPDHPDWREEWR